MCIPSGAYCVTECSRSGGVVGNSNLRIKIVCFRRSEISISVLLIVNIRILNLQLVNMIFGSELSDIYQIKPFGCGNGKQRCFRRMV